MKKTLFSMLLTAILLLTMVLPAAAQSDSGYVLKITRMVGGEFGNQIIGTYKLALSGDLTAVQSVEFRIDGQTIGTDNESPFSLVFDTSKFDSGDHKLTAVVSTSDGSTFETPARSFDFMSGSESNTMLGKILLPILGIVVLMMLVQFLMARKQPLAHIEPGTPRDYGLKGGAICSHCGRPFVIHMWAMNLMPTMRLDRCDFCGKWGVQHTVSLHELRAAEQREIAQARPENPIPEKSEEEKLKEMLEKTKYNG